MAMPTSGLAKEVGVTFLNEGIDCCHDENNCLFAPSPSPSTIFVGKMSCEEKAASLSYRLLHPAVGMDHISITAL